MFRAAQRFKRSGRIPTFQELNEVPPTFEQDVYTVLDLLAFQEDGLPDEDNNEDDDEGGEGEGQED